MSILYMTFIDLLRRKGAWFNSKINLTTNCVQCNFECKSPSACEKHFPLPTVAFVHACCFTFLIFDYKEFLVRIRQLFCIPLQTKYLTKSQPEAHANHRTDPSNLWSIHAN